MNLHSVVWLRVRAALGPIAPDTDRRHADAAGGFRWYSDAMKKLILGVVIAGLFVVPAFSAPPAAPVFPDLRLVPVTGSKPVQLSSLRGRPVLIDFWATWCPPCRMELPELQKLYNEFGKRGFTVAAINVDRTPSAVPTFLKMMKLNLPVFRVDLRILRELGIRSLPTSVLLDADGRVNQVYQGYSPRMANDLRNRIVSLLPKARATRHGKKQTRPSGS